jgi:hypothetical protein
MSKASVIFWCLMIIISYVVFLFAAGVDTFAIFVITAILLGLVTCFHRRTKKKTPRTGGSSERRNNHD